MGQACKSGLAFESSSGVAECVETESIKYKGSKLKSPYECDPTNTSAYCELHHSGGSYLEVPCECALDGNNGYCSSIIGTKEY